jgi:hypothetical protein
MTCLPKTKVNFKFQLPVMFVFLVLHISGLTESHSTSEDLPAYKIEWFHIEWCKFCIHLTSLNICHFGMVEATGLKHYEVQVTFNSMTSLLYFMEI